MIGRIARVLDGHLLRVDALAAKAQATLARPVVQQFQTARFRTETRTRPVQKNGACAFADRSCPPGVTGKRTGKCVGCPGGIEVA